MYNKMNDIPDAIKDFYHEVPMSELVTKPEYNDDGGVIKEATYREWNEVQELPRPERKELSDLERVIALGKPQHVLDRFAELVSITNEWSWFDTYNTYLDEVHDVNAYNADLPVTVDEEGNDVEAEPKALPEAPVKPVFQSGSEILNMYYSARRKALYPDLAEFADAYVKLQDGNEEPMNEYVAKCLHVKEDIPKND